MFQSLSINAISFHAKPRDTLPGNVTNEQIRHTDDNISSYFIFPLCLCVYVLHHINIICHIYYASCQFKQKFRFSYFYYKRHFMGHHKNIESKTHFLCRIGFHIVDKSIQKERERAGEKKLLIISH